MAGVEVTWREDKDLPPSRDRICSPYDTDARYATKRGTGWEGYKVHLSTNVATTDATLTDVEMLGRSTLVSTAAICFLISTSWTPVTPPLS
jgi:hypothetical protein